MIGPGGTLKRRFLGSLRVTRHVTSALSSCGRLPMLRVNPKVNILARFLLRGKRSLAMIRLSVRSISCLRRGFPILRNGVLTRSFLHLSLNGLFPSRFYIVNGCPCGVSDRVFFGILSCGRRVPYYSNVVRGRITRHLTTNPNDGACNVLDILLRT